MARPARADIRELSNEDCLALENAAASARLEGVEIPEHHQRLAAAFLAGEFDQATYRARVRALVAEDLGIGL